MTAAALSREDVFSLHATCLVIAETAVLVRGASGLGKTSLALALIESARRRGWFARLVGDDRVLVRAAGSRLIAAPHPLIAGRVERRFAGVGPVSHEGEAVVRLVVDLCDRARDSVPRLPCDAQTTPLGGVDVRRLQIPAGHAGAVDTILHALREFAA